ncbi:thioredoxin family protein [Maritimibacter sp. HL-12]|uniref:DUF1223 domain-containing protein n=1 Tax=Maritimibacter sp. HL-12 TaxID=1162418 RepID=UPI000A1C8044|nr:DUF1223 domain-containing protein [Maritimibacter sp. HL-12]
MRSFLLAATTALAGFVSSPALADEKPLVVLELFTSQGCSNCPPADALVAELSARDDVLPLALHVDYWDYIGWADSFAQPEYTARQKGYARAAGHGSIYTPQMVIGGVDHVVGFKPMKVAGLLQAHGEKPADVEIEAEIVDGQFRIICKMVETGAQIGRMNVDLVTYIPQATVKIRTGENAGETITYANIVTGWERLGVWSGEEAFAVMAPTSTGARHAVIVQEEGPGPVLAAFRLR